MKLNYKKHGSGPPLIILHGMLGSLDNWQTLGMRFGEAGFETWILDQRNHGHSPWADEWSYETMAADLRLFIQDHNILEPAVLGHSMGGKTLGEHRLTLMRPYVFGQNHIYEVIKLVNNLSISVVPVLDEDNMYMGSITLGKLVQSFAGLAAANDPGGIIALELNSNDYSLTQIANIVEGNDARILSMYVASTADSTKMAVIIKVNRTDLSGILQTFNRYDYLVTASFYDNEAIDDVKQRYDSFMNYLNI